MWPGAGPPDDHLFHQPFGHILEDHSGEQGFEVLFFFSIQVGITYQAVQEQETRRIVFGQYLSSSLGTSTKNLNIEEKEKKNLQFLQGS